MRIKVNERSVVAQFMDYVYIQKDVANYKQTNDWLINWSVKSIYLYTVIHVRADVAVTNFYTWRCYFLLKNNIRIIFCCFNKGLPNTAAVPYAKMYNVP